MTDQKRNLSLKTAVQLVVFILILPLSPVLITPPVGLVGGLGLRGGLYPGLCRQPGAGRPPASRSVGGAGPDDGSR